MNSEYLEETSRYDKKDAYTAIIFWVALIVLYAFSGFFGIVYAQKNS